ncbi:MAG: methylated-DNA--[protein]-cysteine S-methyltransferase [Chromatiales bacterium]|nr:methylated-DNA--[protein]-cysteine S-methyltransferase [Chromatiales bacterium]
MNTESPQDAADYARVAAAIDWLQAQPERQHSLETLAVSMDLAPAECANLLHRWAGLSPQRFIAQLSLAQRGELLARRSSGLDTARVQDRGSPGWLQDLPVKLTALPPGDQARGGDGLTIRHGISGGRYGEVLLAWTSRGLCHLSFLDRGPGSSPVDRLAALWPRARLAIDPGDAARLAHGIFSAARPADRTLSLLVSGTPFQVQVWRALLRIPPGQVASYAEVAAAAGRPGAARAAGNAVGANPLAFVIPCHRVVRSNGSPGGYRWGTTRKLALLACEQARPG